MSNFFITGGAGFIGKRMSAALVASGNKVSIFDNFHPQVHKNPSILIAELESLGVKVVRGNVCDSEFLARSMLSSGANVIVHLAAETGTGQSYDLPSRYCEVNVTGTANVVEAARAVKAKGVDLQRVILAGSRAVYGEGACLDDSNNRVTAIPRKSQDLLSGDFSPKNQHGVNVNPIPSRASSTVVSPSSIYASTKLMQEFILQQGLEQTGIQVGILRLQNVYGAGQSLNNPYTGVLSIFCQQLLEGKVLNIFEDGEIVRDFVNVSDVVSAFVALCEIEVLPNTIIDIGSGRPDTILGVANLMSEIMGFQDIRTQVTGQFRTGDIRYAVADISDAKEKLAWSPRVGLRAGITELVEWARISNA